MINATAHIASTTAPLKPTPAQRKWLELIAKGDVVRDSHSWVEGLLAQTSVRSKSPYTMTLALHKAGWIDAKRVPNTAWRYRVHLTDAGHAAIGLAAPASPTPEVP